MRTQVPNAAEELEDIRRKSDELLQEALRVVDAMGFMLSSDDNADYRPDDLDELRDQWMYLGNRLATQNARYRLVMDRELPFPDFGNGLERGSKRW